MACPLSRRNPIAFGAMAALLMVSFFWINSAKALWLDELLTLYQVADHGWRSLWESCSSGYNLMPLGHFALMKIWTSAFGISATALRLPSLLSIVVSVPLVAATLVRAWGRLAGVLATLTLFTHSPMVVQHLAEARPYALMWLVAGLQWALMARLADCDRDDWRWPALNVLLSALAPFITYTGGIFSAAIFCGAVMSDLSVGRCRWRLWSSFPIGWVLWALGGGWALFTAQMSNNHGGTLVQKGTLTALRDVYAELFMTPFVLPLLLVFLAFWRRARPALGDEAASDARGRSSQRFLMIVSAWMILIPGLFWALSELNVIHIFAPRHFLPVCLGLVTWVALVVRSCAGAVDDPVQELKPSARTALAGYAIVCAALLLFQAERIRRYETSTPVAQMAAHLQPYSKTGTPVVTDELNLFFHCLHAECFSGGVRLLVADEGQRKFLRQYSATVADASVTPSELRGWKSCILASKTGGGPVHDFLGKAPADRITSRFMGSGSGQIAEVVVISSKR